VVENRHKEIKIPGKKYTGKFKIKNTNMPANTANDT
jgi:hypothetical protein